MCIRDSIKLGRRLKEGVAATGADVGSGAVLFEFVIGWAERTIGARLAQHMELLLVQAFPPFGIGEV